MALVVVFAWPSREDFGKLKGIAHDLPATFDEWYEEQTKRLTDAEAKGLEVARVPVKAKEFITWCRKNSVSASRASLFAYACSLQA